MDKTFTDSGASRNETTGRTPWTRRFLRGVHFVLRAVRFATLFFVLSTVAVVIVYRFVPPPLTPLMALRLVDQVRAGEPLTLKKDWTPLNRMSPWMPAAVITSEDQRFFEHHGFDFKAIEKARRHNERVRERALNGGRGGRLRGASTISQQTAKNVFLWPARSWTRKGLEVWFTFLIETLWSKERILEVYLNVAEMGDGIYGSQAAARHWFDRDASTLTRSQAALLAAILPRPRTWSPRNPPRRVTNRQQWILRQLAGGSTSPSGAPGSSLPYSDTVPDYPTTEDSWEIEPEEIPESAVPSPTDPAPGSDAINEEPLPAPQEPREPAY